jgi:hypothetical protein
MGLTNCLYLAQRGCFFSRVQQTRKQDTAPALEARQGFFFATGTAKAHAAERTD